MTWFCAVRRATQSATASSQFRGPVAFALFDKLDIGSCITLLGSSVSNVALTFVHVCQCCAACQECGKVRSGTAYTRASIMVSTLFTFVLSTFRGKPFTSCSISWRLISYTLCISNRYLASRGIHNLQHHRVLDFVYSTCSAVLICLWKPFASGSDAWY